MALAERFGADEDYAPASRQTVAPGTAFIRDWRGERHVVFATTEGFRLGDKTYASLSAVALRARQAAARRCGARRREP